MSKSAKKLNKEGNRDILVAAFCPLFAWLFLLITGINKKKEANKLLKEELISQIRDEVENEKAAEITELAE